LRDIAGLPIERCPSTSHGLVRFIRRSAELREQRET